MTEEYSQFLETLRECPFCEKGLYNHTLVEREHAYLTYAFAPYHKHHLLVLPRRHIVTIDELSLEEEEDIDELQRIGLSMLRALGYQSITLMVREGKVEKNKSIDHTHFHVVPFVQIGDVNHYGQKRRILSEEEVREVVTDLERVLAQLPPIE